MRVFLNGKAERVMADRHEWWRGAVVYQIYPRSFFDANGDGVGDLPGMTRKLSHIARLGADAVWISPFFKSPMKDFGYDVSDYRDVDPLFGNFADFEALLVEAHRLGLRVIIDLVLSHTSDAHPWFLESKGSRDNPKADWYVWAEPREDGSPPNNWLSVFGGSAWKWCAGRRQYFLHNFLDSQPDLNFHNPEVRRALLDVARFWLDRGVDGFRLDTVNFYFHDAALRDNPPLPPDSGVFSVPRVNPYAFQEHLYDKTRPETPVFLAELRRLTDAYPDRVLVGELGVDGPGVGHILGQYTERDKRLHMAYVFELLTERFSAGHIREVVERLTREIGDGWICWSLGNHDVTRVLSRWGLKAAAAKAGPLLFALLLSLRGSACIYQGEELGLDEVDIPFAAVRDPYGLALWPEFKGRDGCRTPMPWERNAANAGFTAGQPWLPIPASHCEKAVDGQEGDAASILSRCRCFAAWRGGVPELRDGDMCFLPAPEDVLLFVRGGGAGRVLAGFNLGSAPTAFPVAGAWEALAEAGFGGVVRDGKIFLDGYDAVFCREAGARTATPAVPSA